MSSTLTIEWTETEIDYLQSLPESTQQAVFESLSQPERESLKAKILSNLDQNEVISEREYQRRLKESIRKRERDLCVPLPAEPNRRNDCLEDFELLATTYFSSIFYEDFTADRRDMVASIIDAAMYGGDQAIAGPRGEGKTKLAIIAALYLMLSGHSRFPMVIGKSQDKAKTELKTIKEKLQQAKLFIADFPEICVPFVAVGGWSSRARMQTVGGELTNIELAPDHLIFPTIGRNRLPDNWPVDCEPVSRGQILASMGIDGPIRGTNFRDERITIVIIDDIESRESADSDAQIEANEEIIEKDIGGLGSSSQRASRVMLCTTQNRKCIAYKYTDPKQKPSWKGRRYRKMLKPPTRMDLAQTYISMRQERTQDDPDARVAFAYWRDNRAEIEADCVVSNVNSFDMRFHSDGEPLELSAIQSYYNRVADFGAKAVATEIDNDPPEEAGPIGIGITADIVVSRISGLAKRQLPINTVALTAAIDLGKYRCHWVVCAWWQGAGGVVVDYGVAEVYGNDKADTPEASEPAIYRTLLNWRDELSQKKFVDGTGTERKVDFCLVDSGSFTNAAYEFTRQVKGIFHPSKGLNPYHQKKASTDTIIAGTNLHASRLISQGVWLYDLDASYWKQWVHERFLTATFDEGNMLRRGSLSLYSTDGTKTHSSIAQHVVAEEWVSEFKDGKGVKNYWNVKNDNNHWLDAISMCAAGSEVCGVKLMAVADPVTQPKPVDVDKPKAQPKQQQHGRFKTRPGGWVPRRR